MIGRCSVNSGGKAFAYLSVTYPAGSICTCSLGGRTLRARTTSGYVIFAIPSAGVWTIKITDGIRTETKAVTISYEGQFASTSIVYTFVLWGGAASESSWSFIAKAYSSSYTGTQVPSHSVSDGVLTISQTSSSGVKGGLAYFTDPVDLTAYKTLRLTGTIVSGDTADAGVGLVIYPSIPSYLTSSSLAVINAGRSGTLSNPTLDVSSINQAGIIGIKLIANSGAGTARAVINNLVLEE